MNGKELLERGIRRGIPLWRIEEELDWQDVPGIRVQVHLHPGGSGRQAVNLAAAYLHLDTWAVNQEAWSLVPVRNAFATADTLFVWFFRGGQVVWEEQIRCPGYKQLLTSAAHAPDRDS